MGIDKRCVSNLNERLPVQAKVDEKAAKERAEITAKVIRRLHEGQLFECVRTKGLKVTPKGCAQLYQRAEEEKLIWWNGGVLPSDDRCVGCQTGLMNLKKQQKLT